MKTSFSLMESDGTYTESFSGRNTYSGLEDVSTRDLRQVPDSSVFTTQFHMGSNSQIYEPVSSSSGGEDNGGEDSDFAKNFPFPCFSVPATLDPRRSQRPGQFCLSALFSHVQPVARTPACSSPSPSCSSPSPPLPQPLSPRPYLSFAYPSLPHPFSSMPHTYYSSPSQYSVKSCIPLSPPRSLVSPSEDISSPPHTLSYPPQSSPSPPCEPPTPPRPCPPRFCPPLPAPPQQEQGDPAPEKISKSDSAEHGGTPRPRSRRKPAHPQRSLDPADPSIRGVTLLFHVHLVHGRPHLLIQPFYRCKRTRVRRRYHRSDSFSESKSGSDSEDSHPSPSHCPAPHSSAAKCCASCGTRRTPLWRDAEDGTPLCNACGIRYRKYRVRCSRCWHIPKKDGKTYPACAMCGGPLRVNQNRKAW